MRPFQEFRVWIRRAPASERVGAGVAAVIVVALLAYLLVPGSDRTSTDVTAAAGAGGAETGGQPETGAGEPVTPGVNPVPAANGPRSGGPAVPIPAAANANTGGGGAGPGGATPGAANSSGGSGQPTATSTPSARRCVSPPGSAPGVSATEIKVAVMRIDIAGPAANAAFDIPSTDEQKRIFDAVIDGVNAEGGIACRKVVAQYFAVNPADQNDQQSKCLEATQAQPFVVIDPGAYSFTSPMCFAQRRVPYFGGFLLTTREAQQGYPYLFNLANYDHLYRDTILGLRARGAFDPAKGFKKLGFFYRNCRPELISQQLATLHQAGVPDEQIVTYDFGCPTAFTSPADLAQAVLKFQSNGVTHVTSVYGYGDLANFTNVAEQQGFRPQYLLADDGILAISYGTLRPNPSNIANALAVTATRNGEERTPGMSPTAATQKCDAIFKAHGLPPSYRQHQLAGNACNELWMIKAAAERAPAIRADALAPGLQAAKSVEFSYPSAPNDFTGRGVTTGGQFWRVTQYFSSCSCWRVIDATFRRTHP
jgi:hypothetical protein